MKRRTRDYRTIAVVGMFLVMLTVILRLGPTTITPVDRAGVAPASTAPRSPTTLVETAPSTATDPAGREATRGSERTVDQVKMADRTAASPIPLLHERQGTTAEPAGPSGPETSSSPPTTDSPEPSPAPSPGESPSASPIPVGIGICEEIILDICIGLGGSPSP
jgi:hypothetical protein